MLKMHDLLQEMGQDIVRRESIKSPERRSRLWKLEEVIDVLKKNKENDDVEGIILDWRSWDKSLSSNSDLRSWDKSLSLNSDFLEKMTRLRFFKIDGHDWYFNENSNICLVDNGLKSFSDKLRYFHWDNYYMEALPSNFNIEYLVVLIMRGSKPKKLWDGIQVRI
ncbi:hypothetical protein Fmac_025548 [Flemingia macrophylla]|uniref:Uncharacterized protein n=1 Tax=Flemingia macrophylla TaxID=520843 RepID=A0ABD1LSI6_9FABA